MSKRPVVIAFLLSIVMSAPCAYALPVTFDFLGTGGSGPAGNPLGLGIGDFGSPSVIVSSGGLSMVITGKDTDLTVGPSANLDRTAVGGLGVVDGAAFARVGQDEAIEFDFSPVQVLALDSLILEAGNTSGSLELVVDGILKETVTWNSGGFTLVTHAFSSAPVGSVFELRGKTNGFRVAGFTVEPVPEPNTALMLLVGAVGMAALRRRSRRVG